MRVIIGVMFLCSILGYQSEGVKANSEKNDLILKTLGSVSQGNIYKTVEELQKFGTRYSWKKQEEVANYLFKKFQEYDIPVQFDEYYFNDKKWKNIVATIHGQRKPEDIYIMIAHYDSISNQPEISAPGADDNASGTAAILEIARNLKDVKLSSSVQLGIFSNEEQGRMGSKHFAKKAHKEGLRIKGCINLDVIGYNDALRSLSQEASKRSSLIDNVKERLKTIRNQTLEYLHPNGTVIIAGKPENEGLVKVTSSLFGRYSNVHTKEKVGKDCG